ncbi:MAG TPA: hypothetical protein ENI49_01375 [Thermoplasmatales archaeon]|nr:hypothetical protein [Thermoplasmatales archaeon]
MKKNIRKLLKKSIQKDITDNLTIPMAKNCIYKKKDLVDTAIFSISNDNSIEYGCRYLRGKGKNPPSSDDVFYHLNKLTKKNVIWLFDQVNHTLLTEVKKKGDFQGKDILWSGYT